MKKMYTYFYALVLLGSFWHVGGVENKSTADSSVLKDYSVMSTDELKEALYDVVSQNNEGAVAKILANPQAKDFSEYDLRKALELAAKHNHLNIAKKLIQAGADIKE